MSYTIETRDLPTQPIATIRVQTTEGEIASVMDTALPEVWGYLESAGVQPSGPPFARYHHFSPDNVDIEVGFPVPAPVAGAGRVVASELPGGTVAVTDHLGPYDQLGGAYAALEQWVTAHGHDPQGATVWEIYWTDPGAEPDPAKWRTEVVWPLGGSTGSG
jgi:effector-binding domain-containing protein